MGKPSSRGFSRNVHTSARHDSEAERKYDIEGIEKELKPLLLGIIERAFRRFMNAHGAPKDVEDLEWTRFKKILNGML